MNYLAELRAFDEWLETHELPCSAIALWFALMQVANKTGWKSSFNVAIAVLEHKSGLDRRTVYRARNTLKQYGLISFRDRGANRSSEYSINSVCQYDTHCDTHSVTHCDTHSVTQSVTQCVTIPKPNETKQIEESKEKTPLEKTFDEFKEMRKKIKAPMTEHAADLILKKLDDLASTDDGKIAILNQSIENSWRGVFALNGGKGGGKPHESRYDTL